MRNRWPALPASRLPASENKAEGTREESTSRPKESAWWELGKGPGRRDQANPKNCNPFPGQDKAGPVWDTGTTTVSALEEVVSRLARNCKANQGLESASPTGSGVPKASSLAM